MRFPPQHPPKPERKHSTAGTLIAAAACVLVLVAACTPPPAAPPTQAELDEARRIEEYDATAVATLNTVAAAVRYIEATGIGLSGANAASLTSLGLTVDAPQELADAIGSAVAPILYISGETTTPWEMSLVVPDGSSALWVGAVRSERYCLAIVMDADFGDWSGYGDKDDCSAGRAGRSYGEARGVVGEREKFTWVVLERPDPADAESPPGPGGALDAAAWAVLDTTVQAARFAATTMDLSAASAESLSTLSLTVEASEELAEALGSDRAPIVFITSASTSPWKASVDAPHERDRDDVRGLWSVAVFTPLACRAIVLDPELGEWAGVATSGSCSGETAKSSYAAARGIGGHRGGFSWLPLPAAPHTATTTSSAPAASNETPPQAPNTPTEPGPDGDS